MSLAANVSFGTVSLRIERVEVLLKPRIGRDTGVDRTPNRFGGSGFH